MEKEVDKELKGEEKNKALEILKKIPFNELIIGGHYYKKGTYIPRHGISIEKAREIYNQSEKIILISYRNSKAGKKYAVIYKINEKESYYLLFFLDKNPPHLFNAYMSERDIEKRLLKKFGFKW